MPDDRAMFATSGGMWDERQAPQAPLLFLRFPGRFIDVREALNTVKARLAPLDISDDGFATAELVLAEVLNNVVEHAYATRDGDIALELRLCDGAIACLVTDTGRSMPRGTPPSGNAKVLNVPLDELPEGGFGWYLIRSLTQELAYRRERRANHLSFKIPLDIRERAP